MVNQGYLLVFREECRNLKGNADEEKCAAEPGRDVMLKKKKASFGF